MADVSTPCVKTCVLDPVSGLCIGCGRTTDEIAAWGAMSEEARLALMATLPARREAAALARVAAKRKARAMTRGPGAGSGRA